MSVRIHGVPFQVSLCDTRLTMPNMGECLFDQCEINIQEHLPRARQEEVLIHEIVHALLDGEEHIAGIDEHFVRRLGNSLYNCLNDNGLLVEDWFERSIDETASERGRPQYIPSAAARGTKA